MSHASIPGCCGYMPSLLKERWNKLLDLDLTLNKFESPKFNSRLIPVIHSIRMYDIPSEFPEIDAWLTPIHKVSNRKGKFYSQDLKDYLGYKCQSSTMYTTINVKPKEIPPKGKNRSCFPGNISVKVAQGRFVWAERKCKGNNRRSFSLEEES
jgi:hypothetical protein